ncbi:MAG: sugar phosphate isomerase/epimerase [Candidatus Vogelbacteria bacterium]|nr:sugar phosphate isomerase/epimerase [Candidatus Vogelbacteria bacterium]
MYKFGLKLWSINDCYIGEVVRLFEVGVYDYIELFIVPGSFDKYNEIWKGLKIPFIIHAPHSRAGMNLAKSECRDKNKELFFETQKFADAIDAKKIIVHAGTAGDVRETVRQLKLFYDERLLIENKPYHSLDNGLLCNGTTPEEIRFIMQEVKVGFCLDISHAIYSANAYKVSFQEFLKDFSGLKPHMYHLADGDTSSVFDQHYHIDAGNFDFGSILSFLPRDGMITIETLKDSNENLIDFVKDAEILRNYEICLRAKV